MKYHDGHWFLYADNIKEEEYICGNNAPNSVLQLNNMVNEKDGMSWKHLQVTTKFVADVSTNIIYYMGYFKSQKPCTLYTYEKMEDFQIFLDAHAILTHESTQNYFIDDFDEMPIA